MGKGIRQNRFVTLGKELALKDGCMGNDCEPCIEMMLAEVFTDFGYVDLKLGNR